jgi:hypothetical protein
VLTPALGGQVNAPSEPGSPNKMSNCKGASQCSSVYVFYFAISEQGGYQGWNKMQIANIFANSKKRSSDEETRVCVT